jgi:hypothetical protein
MPYDLASLSSILVSAHQKIAAIHIELANQMQLEFSENTRSPDRKIPASPGSSDSTSTQQFVAEDDDFADSPILSNSSALQRAKQKQKNPLVNRMKLKKSSSIQPPAKQKAHRVNGFLAFQAENRSKVL